METEWNLVIGKGSDTKAIYVHCTCTDMYNVRSLCQVLYNIIHVSMRLMCVGVLAAAGDGRLSYKEFLAVMKNWKLRGSKVSVCRCGGVEGV